MIVPFFQLQLIQVHRPQYTRVKVLQVCELANHGKVKPVFFYAIRLFFNAIRLLAMQLVIEWLYFWGVVHPYGSLPPHFTTLQVHSLALIRKSPPLKEGPNFEKALMLLILTSRPLQSSTTHGHFLFCCCCSCVKEDNQW